MLPKEPTYEALRDEVAGIESASSSRERTLVWVTDQRSVALARDADGRLEIFLPGPALQATLKVVANVIEHDVWSTDALKSLSANRLVLPRGEHFDQFGALLCTELLEQGVEADLQTAFSAVEPLIALALTREVATDRTVTGLVGEMLLLENLLLRALPTSATALVQAWAGSAPSARDFQTNGVGVEVKTTQGSASVHHVQGVHQVELGHSNDGGLETHLFLLSLGVGFVARREQGRSLPELVDSVLAHLPDPDDRSDLLARIKQYGGDAAVGYDHARDRVKPRYSTRYFLLFERLYDMSDERLKMLSSEQLVGLKNVDHASVNFRIVLEDRVRGDRNPITGWPAIVARILGLVGIPQRAR